MKKNFGIIWFLPIFMVSFVLSILVPNVVGALVFIISFVIFLFTKKYHLQNKLFFHINFILMLLCAIHFFGFCIIELDTTEYDSLSEEKTAEALSWVLYLPLAFLFSFVAALFFDKWINYSKP